MKIVILDAYTSNPGDLSWDALSKIGNLEIFERTNYEQIVERSIDAEAIFVNKVIITKEIIDQLPKLKYIGVLATGVNGIDIAAAQNAGITICNTPAYSTDSVAQMVFSHILHFSQNISTHTNAVKNGKWSNNKDFCFWITPQIELANKTLGIIGFGNIGQKVAEIGLAFGMKVIFHNRSKKQTTINAQQVSFDELLTRSDYISLNCPLTNENRAFINADVIRKMKKTAFLINTGRGALINEKDLADALNNNKIAGAGLDVLAQEPPSKDNPLIKAKNCFITPHIAWATTAARKRLIQINVDNLKAFLAGSPQNIVTCKK